MDFDLRQWLLILGPIFIAGVLVHGYFRMRASQNDIRMKLDKAYLSQSGEAAEGVDDLSLLKAELPNGGARLLGGEPADEAADNEGVPVLMESVDLPSSAAAEAPAAQSQQSTAQSRASAPAATASKPDSLSASRDDDFVQPAVSISADPDAARGRTISDENRSEGVNPHSEVAAPKAPPARKPEEDNAEAAPKPEKFVVINVLALDQPFGGQALVDILHAAGMSFGEMSIFHKLSDDDEPEFSLASAVEPGTFDMSTISDFSTPGVTIFMRVHELAEPLAVLDDLLSVADSIAQELNGEIRDDTRSVMTSQTIEHCRQSIREFQYKHSA